jgi:hypothetical protein
MNHGLSGVVARVWLLMRCLAALQRGQRVYLLLSDHGWQVVGGEFEV